MTDPAASGPDAPIVPPTRPAADREDGAGTAPRILSGRTVSWALWDWGSAAFNAVATTFVFTVYLTTLLEA